MSANEKGGAAKTVVRNLHDAIEQVRADVAKVEFWADAMTGFSQPVPGYDSGDVKIWLPQEQARSLDGQSQAKDANKDKGRLRR